MRLQWARPPAASANTCPLWQRDGWPRVSPRVTRRLHGSRGLPRPLRSSPRLPDPPSLPLSPPRFGSGADVLTRTRPHSLCHGSGLLPDPSGTMPSPQATSSTRHAPRQQINERSADGPGPLLTPCDPGHGAANPGPRIPRLSDGADEPRRASLTGLGEGRGGSRVGGFEKLECAVRVLTRAAPLREEAPETPTSDVPAPAARAGGGQV